MEIPEIKERLPLSRVLQHYGLKPDKHGRLHCPFHDDKTPSLQVYEKTNTVYCFSSNCSTHGKALDVIDFVMHKEGCTKHEAIERCKQLIGALPPVRLSLPPGPDPSAGQPTPDYAALLRQFVGNLKKSPQAQAYLQKRVLSPALGIGYNAVGWPHLKHCIVFELRDKDGKIVSLYGRSMYDKAGSKHYYLPDRKGLYPWYPHSHKTQLILTESIIDAASLLQINSVADPYNLLALYGTNGLTDEHLDAIGSLAGLQEIILLLNGDEPGRVATRKHAHTLHACRPGVTISSVSLPEGEDVNSLLQTHPDTFVPLITDLLGAREIFFSAEKKEGSEPAELLIESPDIPAPAAPMPPCRAAETLDTTNPYKLRYSASTANYYIQGSLPKTLDTLKVMLVIEHPGTGLKARNRVDLYEDKPVERLCQEVSEKLQLRRDLLEADLYKLTDLLDQYREQVLLNTTEGSEKPLPVLTAKERQEGESFAKKPKLIKRLNELLGQAGIVGEERNRIFLLLIAISHKMPETLHGLLQGSSGSGKTRLLKQISDCMPPESVTKLTRLSDKVLYNFPEHYFVNRLLCLEDIDGLSEEAEFAFRELQSNGELNSATSIKLESGQITSGQKTVKGPIASLACTTRGEIYEDNMSRVFLIAVDESPEQTARIIDYQNGVASGLVSKDDERKTKAFLQNFVRLLEPYEVVNPYAGRIRLPPEAHKIRRLNDLFQSFVKMVTIVNQYQRKKDASRRLISTMEDIETAVAVLFDSIVLKVDELDGSLRQFYEQLKAHLKQQHNGHHQSAEFSLREIRQALKLSKTQLFRYAADLVQLEYIRASGGHANKGYTYQVGYWDNYEGLRERIRRSLDEQVKALKVGTPAAETARSGTPRNASGTLEPA